MRCAAKPVDVDMRQPRTFATARKPLNALTLAVAGAPVRLFAGDQRVAAADDPARARRRLRAARRAERDLNDELADLEGNGMQLSVICAEDADLLGDRPDDAKLILGDALVRVMRAQCEVWPRGTRPADFHAPVQSDKPVLILEGEWIRSRRRATAKQILKGLPNGRLLVAKGQGHSVSAAAACRDWSPRTSSRRIDAKALDAGCIADFGPTPAFIDFNGAAP